MTSKNLESLIIHKIESQELYDYLIAKGEITDDDICLVGGESTAVLYTAQELTDEQKAQVLENIGALSISDKYEHPTYASKASGFYKVTIDSTGHVSGATAVTKADITNLGIPTQDTVYTHPTHTAYNSGLYKVTINSLGHVTSVTAVTKSDITNLGIPSKDTTYSMASASNGGLMSAAHYSKVESLENYEHPTHTAFASGIYKITVDNEGHIIEATVVTKDDITDLGIPAQDTTYNNASGNAAGLMSPDDYTKLAGIDTGANKTVIDSTMSDSSTNPVQNKVVKAYIDESATAAVAEVVNSAPDLLNTLDELAAALGDDPNFATTVTNALGNKVDKVDGKELSSNDFTDTLLTKLNGLENYTHPSYTAKSSGFYKITVDATGHVNSVTAVTKADITGLGIPAQDTTYSTGNASTAGITKLYTNTGTNTDGAMTQSATNTALAAKADLSSGKVKADQASATITDKSSSFTVSTSYAGQFIRCTNSSAITLTIASGHTVGTEIEVCRFGAGTVTFAGASGVTIYSVDSAKTIESQYGCVALKCVASNTWILAGCIG